MTSPASPNFSPLKAAHWWRGFTLALLTTVCLSLQNVFARIAQSPKAVPMFTGLFELGGYVANDANKLQISLPVTAILVVLLIARPLPIDVLIPEKWGAILLVDLGVLLMSLGRVRSESS